DVLVFFRARPRRGKNMDVESKTKAPGPGLRQDDDQSRNALLRDGALRAPRAVTSPRATWVFPWAVACPGRRRRREAAIRPHRPRPALPGPNWARPAMKAWRVLPLAHHRPARWAAACPARLPPAACLGRFRVRRSPARRQWARSRVG